MSSITLRCYDPMLCSPYGFCESIFEGVVYLRPVGVWGVGAGEHGRGGGAGRWVRLGHFSFLSIIITLIYICGSCSAVLRTHKLRFLCREPRDDKTSPFKVCSKSE